MTKIPGQMTKNLEHMTKNLKTQAFCRDLLLMIRDKNVYCVYKNVYLKTYTILNHRSYDKI